MYIETTHIIETMEIKIHTEEMKRSPFCGTMCPRRVISFIVGGRRLFFLHIITVDRRGTHYGDDSEELILIKNPNKYKRLRKSFVRRSSLGDDILKSLDESSTKSLRRWVDALDCKVGKWVESRG